MDMKELMESMNGESEIRLVNDSWSLRTALIWWLATRFQKRFRKTDHLLITYKSGGKSSDIDYIVVKIVKMIPTAQVSRYNFLVTRF